MPCCRLAPTLLLIAACVAGSTSSFAQSQSQEPPEPLSGFKPPPAPPMAPIKPYKAIAVTPPAPFTDASFVAFRKQLADIAERKDRAALAKLIVAQDFFWMQDKDLADKHKPGIDNFAKAINLDAKDGSGWEGLFGYAAEQTGAPFPMQPDMICAPANPTVDIKAFQDLVEATQTQPSDWGYATKDGVEVRAAAQPNAAVVDKLGVYLVRVLSDSAPPDDPNQQAFLHIATPAGKAGFIPADALSGLGGDAICYRKDGAGWKIAGFFGGAGE